MKPENADFLNQLADALEKGEASLEDAYRRGDSASFSKVKRFIMQIQGKIFEAIK